MVEDGRAEIPNIPELAADYEFVRELGRGGTAVVYLARDRELGRDVAIKLILPTYVQDEDAVARLVREARTVGRLQHPGIVMLLGTRRLGSRGLALILQYVPGETLKSRIRRSGPLPFPEAERILRDLGHALEYAHSHRIVHRDIKPENVYLDEGSGMARLADFGLARGWDSDSGLTLPGTGIGTPTYMSPEQIDGLELDGRSDLYSLGLVGYEAITGEQPWAGESLYSLIQKQKNEELPALRDLRPDTPERLVRAIEGATRKAPEDRWPRARDFLDVLSGRRQGIEGATVLEPTGEVPEWTAPATGETPFLAPMVMAETPTALEATSPGDGAPAGPLRGLYAIRRRWLIPGTLVVAMIVFLLMSSAEGGVRSGLGAVGSFTFGLLVPGASDPPPAPLPGTSGSEGSGIGMLPERTGSLPPAGGRSGAVAELVLLDGDEQEAVTGALLSAPISLRVVDGDRLGIPEVPVVFEVLSGGGRVDPERTETGPDGLAMARWQLGPAEGEQVLRAGTEAGDPHALLLRAIGVPPDPATVHVFAGQGQQADGGEPLPGPLTVRVLDPAGRVVPGVPVRFRIDSGDGLLDVEETLTGQAGTASTRWTLGSGGGAQRVLAEVEGLPPGSELTFEASATSATLPVLPAVLAGGGHTCTLRTDGTLVCWGGNDQGQLGDGSRSGRVRPAETVAGIAFASAASGLSHTCALSTAGRILCWGSNSSGQLGSGPGPAQSVPTEVSGDRTFRTLTAGSQHSCALTTEGLAYCWGANDAGQLGDGSRNPRNAPTPVRFNVPFREITAGWSHTCALSGEGIAFCWGDNSSGQLGTGAAATSALPIAVPGGLRYRTLAAGSAHTCGVTTDGLVRCWGANSSGQLGDGTLESRNSAAELASEERFTTVSAGAVHTCALTTDGEARCWGRNLYGQLGDGSQVDRSTPVAVAGSPRFAQLDALGSHTCGRTSAGEVLCWGYNLDGQLGDGTRQNRSTPAPVPGVGP